MTKASSRSPWPATAAAKASSEPEAITERAALASARRPARNRRVERQKAERREAGGEPAHGFRRHGDGCENDCSGGEAVSHARWPERHPFGLRGIHDQKDEGADVAREKIQAGRSLGYRHQPIPQARRREHRTRIPCGRRWRRRPFPSNRGQLRQPALRSTPKPILTDHHSMGQPRRPPPWHLRSGGRHNLFSL